VSPMAGPCAASGNWRETPDPLHISLHLGHAAMVSEAQQFEQLSPRRRASDLKSDGGPAQDLRKRGRGKRVVSSEENGSAPT